MNPSNIKLLVLTIPLLLSLQAAAISYDQILPENEHPETVHHVHTAPPSTESSTEAHRKAQEKQAIKLKQKSNPLHQKSKGGQEGDGGSSVQMNETIETFASAGINVENGPRPLTLEEIPQLRELIDFINNCSFFSTETKNQLIKSLYPTENRQYFRLPTSALDSATYKRLTNIYEPLSKQPANKNVPFGLTNPKNGKTLLFDAFFQFKQPAEQQAALYHEAYWITHPNATYVEVVRAEIHFQNFLQNPITQSNAINVLHDVGTPAEVLTAALQFDVENGALHDLISQDDQGASYLELLDILSLRRWPMTHDLQFIRFPGVTAFDISRQAAATNVIQASMKYPYSMFLKELGELFLNSSNVEPITILFPKTRSYCQYPQENVVVKSLKIYVNENLKFGVFPGLMKATWQAGNEFYDCISKVDFSPLGINATEDP